MGFLQKLKPILVDLEGVAIFFAHGKRSFIPRQSFKMWQFSHGSPENLPRELHRSAGDRVNHILKDRKFEARASQKSHQKKVNECAFQRTVKDVVCLHDFLVGG